ncbi:MAG: hypothetical protein WDW36_006725 [Sanguina aurantia]
MGDTLAATQRKELARAGKEKFLKFKAESALRALKASAAQAPPAVPEISLLPTQYPAADNAPEGQANGSHTEAATPDASANGGSHHLQQAPDQDSAVATSSTHDPPAHQNGHNVITHSEPPAPNGTSHQPAHQEPPATPSLLHPEPLHDSPSQQPHQLLTSPSSIPTSSTPTPLRLDHDEHVTLLPASPSRNPPAPSAVLDQSKHTQELQALTHSAAQLRSALNEAQAGKASSDQQLDESLGVNLALREQVASLRQQKSSLQLETADAHAVCAASETAQLTLQAALSSLQAQSDGADRFSLALQEQADQLLATQAALQQEVLAARSSCADSQAAQTSLQALSVTLRAQSEDAVHSLASLQAEHSQQGTLLENAQLTASGAAREVQALREQLQQAEAGAEERIQSLQETLLQERNQIQQLQDQIQSLHELSGQGEQLVQSQQSRQQQLEEESRAALDALASATQEAQDAELLLADTVAGALRQSEASDAEHAAQTRVHLARVAELEHALAASDAHLCRSSEEAAALIKRLQGQLSGAEAACRAPEAGTAAAAAAAAQQGSGWAHDELDMGDAQPAVGEEVVPSDGRVAELEARVAVLEGVEGKYTALLATQARAKTQFEKAKALLKERKEELEKCKAQLATASETEVSLRTQLESAPHTPGSTPPTPQQDAWPAPDEPSIEATALRHQLAELTAQHETLLADIDTLRSSHHTLTTHHQTAVTDLAATEGRLQEALDGSGGLRAQLGLATAAVEEAHARTLSMSAEREAADSAHAEQEQAAQSALLRLRGHVDHVQAACVEAEARAAVLQQSSDEQDAALEGFRANVRRLQVLADQGRLAGEEVERLSSLLAAASERVCVQGSALDEGQLQLAAVEQEMVLLRQQQRQQQQQETQASHLQAHDTLLQQVRDLEKDLSQQQQALQEREAAVLCREQAAEQAASEELASSSSRSADGAAALKAQVHAMHLQEGLELERAAAARAVAEAERSAADLLQLRAHVSELEAAQAAGNARFQELTDRHAEAKARFLKLKKISCERKEALVEAEGKLALAESKVQELLLAGTGATTAAEADAARGVASGDAAGELLRAEHAALLTAHASCAAALAAAQLALEARTAEASAHASEHAASASALQAALLAAEERHAAAVAALESELQGLREAQVCPGWSLGCCAA